MCSRVRGSATNRELCVEERELVLDLGVARRDDGKPLGLRRRVVGVRDQLVRLDLEHAREQRDGALAGIRDARLDVRQRDARDADPLGQLVLGPAQLGCGASRSDDRAIRAGSGTCQPT